MKTNTKPTIGTTTTEVFKIISRASRIWYEQGRQEEALLHSHQTAITDEIMQLLAKEKKALLEACREIVYSCIYDKEWVELGHPENFEAGKLNETLLEEKLQNLAHSQEDSAEKRSEDREGKK